MVEARRLRAWWDVLLHVAFTGTDTPSIRSVGLRRLRTVAIVGGGLWAGFLTFAIGSAPPAAKTFNVLISVIPCLLAIRSPLWGWRALLVGIVLTPPTLPRMVQFWSWPWSPGLALAAAVVFYLVGASNDQRELACAALISFAAMAPFLRDWRDTALLVVLGGMLFFLGNTVRQRRLAEEARAADQDRRIAEERRAAVLEERAVIARELHDVVAHHMSVLALRADSARFRFAGPGKADLDEGVLREFADLAGTAREGMTELRRLLGVLRSGDGDALVAPQPGLAMVSELVDRVRAAGTPCELDVRGDLDVVPAGVALSVCRIAQEALSNAIRHAPGAPVSVELVAHPRSVRLVIENGPGERPTRTGQTGAGHGLLGMRERAAMLAADLDARVKPDGGFRVALTVPLDDGGRSEP
ncbi:sensor histidine kinase [Amycolatopsis pittospori]|uniref:sensor histidine kinase n=1 Tax=Amycolatopsis pittospori TaxID=2749434 RepID=UPI0015F02DEA|nr:histidine kinase [Amycolatopsis pittospori]